MKSVPFYAFLLISSLLLFTQCGNKANNTQEAGAEQAQNPEALAGCWINDAWWQLLQESQSPKKAAEKADIPVVTIYKDSTGWRADVVYGWHEGLPLALKANGDKFELINDSYENQKMHELALQPDGSLHLDSFVMVRLGDNTEEAWSVVLNTMLGGTYTAKGKTGEVKFSADGSVRGLDDFTRYDMLPDYVVDEVGADQMMFYKNDNMPIFCVFELKGSSLKIFEVKEDKDEYGISTFSKGPLLYDLTKKG